jgi:TetR/AcrR family transcriptional regulator
LEEPVRRAPEAASRSRERRDPLATREALLAAATGLFAERGYDGVATDELAARAHVNKALISYHFGGKRGLYLAALARVFGELAARVKAVEARGLDARETLAGLIRAFSDFARERPDFPGLWLRELISNGIDPTLVPHLVEIAAVTRGLALRGAREGVFRPVDPLLFHFGLLGSVIFFLATDPARRRAASGGHLPFTMPDTGPFLSYVEQLTLRGLAPASGPVRRLRPNASRSAPRQRKGARA